MNQMNTPSSLFNELIQDLGNQARILKEPEDQYITSRFESSFHFDSWGKIQWNNTRFKIRLQSKDEVVPKLKKFLELGDDKIFILWDDFDLPIVETSLEKSIEFMDSVTSVSYDTFLFSPKYGFVIVFYHTGGIWIAINNPLLDGIWPNQPKFTQNP